MFHKLASNYFIIKYDEKPFKGKAIKKRLQKSIDNILKKVYQKKQRDFAQNIDIKEMFSIYLTAKEKEIEPVVKKKSHTDSILEDYKARRRGSLVDFINTGLKVLNK